MRKEGYLPAQALSQAEAAVQGLRKTYLKRDWAPRCAKCGVRHEEIEYGTCKFWVKYKLEPEEEMPEESEEGEGEESSEEEGEGEEEPTMEEVDEPRVVEVG